MENKTSSIVVGLVIAIAVIASLLWGASKVTTAVVNLNATVLASAQGVAQVIASVAPNGGLGGERAGIQEFFDGFRSGKVPVTQFTATAKMAAGSNQVVVWYNNLGRDVWADFGAANIVTGETASSTTNVSLFATTTSSVAATMNFGTLAETQALIHSWNIATSATATSTNSVVAVTNGKGKGAVLVPAGSNLIGYLRQDTAGCGIAGAVSGAACETATSTNRGFNPVFTVKLYY